MSTLIFPTRTSDHQMYELMLLGFPRHALFLIWGDAFVCEGGVDVVGVVTPLVRGIAKVLHGDQVVELSVQLEVQEVEGKEEDREGQVEVEEEKVELKERRT